MLHQTKNTVKIVKILLADDEPDMTRVMGKSLEISGYEVIIAND